MQYLCLDICFGLSMIKQICNKNGHCYTRSSNPWNCNTSLWWMRILEHFVSVDFWQFFCAYFSGLKNLRILCTGIRDGSLSLFLLKLLLDMVLLFIKEQIVIVSLVFNNGAQVTFSAGFKRITFSRYHYSSKLEKDCVHDP